MEKRQLSLLFHPVFLICLALLLINDHYLKFQWHNAFTGKLSDVAGLVVLTIFLWAIFPARSSGIVMLVAILFTWWKSSLSAGVINFFQDKLHLPVSRTVDYTDLFALAVLPFLYLVKPGSFEFSPVLRFGKIVVCFVSITAICATSMQPHLFHAETGHMEFDKQYKTRLSEKDIFYKLDSMQIRYHIDSLENMQVYNNDRLYWRIRNNDTAYWEKMQVQKDTMLYYRYATAPFYIIDTLKLDNDVLYNVRFRVTDAGNKRKIHLMSAVLPNRGDAPGIPTNLYKKYRKMLKTFLVE